LKLGQILTDNADLELYLYQRLLPCQISVETRLIVNLFFILQEGGGRLLFTLKSFSIIDVWTVISIMMKEIKIYKRIFWQMRLLIFTILDKHIHQYINEMPSTDLYILFFCLRRSSWKWKSFLF